MKKGCIIALLLLTLPSVAFASGAAEPAGHEAGAAASHSEGHWSLASELVPSRLDQAVRARMGNTVLGHEPVSDISHVVFGLLIFTLLTVLMIFARVRMAKNGDSVLPEARFSPLALFQILSDALLGLMEGLMGREKALHFLPLVGSLGAFILFSNLLGLIPGFLPPTSNVNTTLALGVVVFVATHYYGVRTHGIGYFKEFFGPIIKWYALPLMIVMFCIEIISHIARPVSLGLRLFGNMFGDHSVLAAFLLVAAGTVASGPWIAKISVVLPLIPMVLGIFVAVVQALVFCILTSVYIFMATEEAEGEEAHA